MPNDSNLILLTGATGYVGGRLLYALETAGYRVRCIRLGRRNLGQITENSVLRIEQTQRALRDEYCWRLASCRKGHAAAALTKTGCGHGEKKRSAGCDHVRSREGTPTNGWAQSLEWGFNVPIIYYPSEPTKESAGCF